MVVSSDSIKNATAISHGTRRLLESASGACEAGVTFGSGGLIFVGRGCIGLGDRVQESSFRAEPFITRSSLDFIEAHASAGERSAPYEVKRCCGTNRSTLLFLSLETSA
jgi:hypothetical protein